MFPFMTVIMLAGLMRIPSELFEAAAVNSAHTASLTSRKPLSCRW
jgi:ABC-type sugar transport system permease subunit